MPNLDLSISDQMNDTEVFGKFMQEMKNSTGLVELGLFQFTLTEDHADKLLEAIYERRRLKKLKIESSIVISDTVQNRLKEACAKSGVDMKFTRVCSPNIPHD